MRYLYYVYKMKVPTAMEIVSVRPCALREFWFKFDIKSIN
jgi:hypothetical protein